MRRLDLPIGTKIIIEVTKNLIGDCSSCCYLGDCDVDEEYKCSEFNRKDEQNINFRIVSINKEIQK